MTRKQIYDKLWRLTHPLHCKEYKKKYNLLHPECRKKYRKKYKKLHPEKRTRSKGISKEAFEEIKAQQNYKCAMCGKPEPFLNQWWHYLTQDHIIPRSKGGKKRSKSNIQALCWDCNVKIKRDNYETITHTIKEN